MSERGSLTQSRRCCLKILAANHTKTKNKTSESSSFFARGAGHAPARATRPRSRSRGDWTRLSAPRRVRRSAPSASEAEHAFRDVTKAHDRETLKHRLAMVHQYPNQEVVDGTAALAGVPGISVTDAKRSVEPRTHLAKVAFDIQDSAVDAHQGTRVTTVNARGFAVLLFSSAAEKPAGRGCEVDAQRRWRGRSTSRPLNDRTLLEPTRACDIVRDRCASQRSRCSRGRSPGARAGSTFSTSGLFIPEISRPRPFVCSPPRLSPRAGRAAGDPVKREGSAEVSHAVRPRRARELPLPGLSRRGRLGSLPGVSDRNNPTPLARFGVPGWHVPVFSRAKTFDRTKTVKAGRLLLSNGALGRSIFLFSFRFRTQDTRLTFASLFFSVSFLFVSTTPRRRNRRTTTRRADPPPRTAPARTARTAAASPTTAATSGTRDRARSRRATGRLRRPSPAGIRRRRRGCGTPRLAAGRAARGRATTGSPGGSRRSRRKRRRLWRRPCRVGRRRRRRPNAGTPRRLRRTCA